MKILDAGDSLLSNADVLDWIKRKRAQHEQEDAEDKARGLKPAARPPNFMTMLNRTERELSSYRYPYMKNPDVYLDDAREAQFLKFVRDAENAIQDHLEVEWKKKLHDMTKEQFEKEFAKQQEMKCLTETEILMIYNHAPTDEDTLQAMIENAEDRFTSEEQGILVQVVARNLRANEQNK